MEDIEFIERAVPYAENFKLINKLGRRSIYTPVGGFSFTKDSPLDDKFWKGAGALLLQRAIEGVNILHGQLCIVQTCTGVEVLDTFDYESIRRWVGISEKHKRSALEYIFNQQIEGES